MQESTELSRTHSFSSKDIREHYDQFAWAYRRYWGDHIHHGLFVTGDENSEQSQRLMLQHCASRAGVQPGMSVADVGCGHGGTVNLLAGEYGCSVLGLTISETQLRLARKTCKSLNGKVRLELADAEAYDFRPESFDLIWNMESTEHFFDKRAYFRKVAGALKPGGKLMVAAWSGSMKDEFVQQVARIFLCPELWTLEEYVREIEAAGLEIVSQEELAAEVVSTWDISAQQIHKSRWMLSILPAAFTEFTKGIELMREGYRNSQLKYSIIVAEKAG